MVLVIGEKRNTLRDAHARHVNDNGTRPAEEPHLAAGIGDTFDRRLLAVRRSGDFEKFSLHLPVPFGAVPLYDSVPLYDRLSLVL